MSALEREIVEKFQQLDKEAQKRVLRLIEEATEVEPFATTFDYDAWFIHVGSLRTEIQQAHSGNYPSIDIVDILRDIRDGEDE